MGAINDQAIQPGLSSKTSLRSGAVPGCQCVRYIVKMVGTVEIYIRWLYFGDLPTPSNESWDTLRSDDKNLVKAPLPTRAPQVRNGRRPRGDTRALHKPATGIVANCHAPPP